MREDSLLEKLETYYVRFREIGQLITDPAVIQDRQRFARLNKEYRELEAVTAAGDELRGTLAELAEARRLAETETDEELVEMARAEAEDLEGRVPVLEERVKLLLVPADPEDEKNVFLEIRAGTGGDEACLFAGDLFRMYVKFCEGRRWRVEVTSCSEGASGGYKEIVAKVSGEGVYGWLKYESGVHRVQRVPATETQGRVHTSAATVAVLPEAEEVDVVLNPADIRKDTYCSSGPGGQSVNTTYSAIRLTHVPTGIVVTCQDEKSQLKNLAKAMTELRSRIYAIEHQKYLDEIASRRRTMVSTGDRSAKIRTYNFPQGRVTDHRVNLTLYNLAAVMDGELGEIIERLRIEENTERLRESGF